MPEKRMINSFCSEHCHNFPIVQFPFCYKGGKFDFKHNFLKLTIPLSTLPISSLDINCTFEHKTLSRELQKTATKRKRQVDARWTNFAL